jgi:hypothetical protein
VDDLPSGNRYREPNYSTSIKATAPSDDAQTLADLAVGDLFDDGNMDVVIEKLDRSPEG